MKILRIILMLLIAFNVASSQNADEIISKSLAARGGKTAFKDLKSLSFSARMITGGKTINMKVWVSYPDNKMRVELTNFTNEKVTTVFAGKKSWMSKDTAVQLIPETTLPLLKGQIDAQIGFFYKNMYNYSKRNFRVEYVGQDMTRNIPVHKIRVTDPDGSEMIYFIDRNNFFEIRFDFLKDVKGNKQNSWFQIRSFVPSSGYYYPSAVDIFNNGANNGSISFSEIVVNPKLKKSLFAMPKKKK